MARELLSDLCEKMGNDLSNRSRVLLGISFIRSGLHREPSLLESDDQVIEQLQRLGDQIFNALPSDLVTGEIS